MANSYCVNCLLLAPKSMKREFGGQYFYRKTALLAYSNSKMALVAHFCAYLNGRLWKKNLSARCKDADGAPLPWEAHHWRWAPLGELLWGIMCVETLWRRGHYISFIVRIRLIWSDPINIKTILQQSKVVLNITPGSYLMLHCWLYAIVFTFA